MSSDFIPLHMLPTGRFGRVRDLAAQESMRRRMLDLGFITNSLVESIRKSPSGDPTAYQIRGTVIALRSEEASNISVELI